MSDGAGGEGVLITTSELKASFAAKTPFQTGADAIDMMYTYYDGSDSSYVCYVPKAKANRTLLGMLRCVSPYVDATHGGMQNPGENGCSSIAPTSDEWNDQDTYAVPESAYWMCVPETASASGAGVPTAVVTP